MSGPPQVVLLDSNAYFRLARTIRPLLQGTFGTSPIYTLYVLDVLDDEYRTNPRLQNKFFWLNQAEYKTDRGLKRYKPAGKKIKGASTAFSYLDHYAREQRLSLAPEDLHALAVGLAFEFIVVTDDNGMCEVARAHGIACWGIITLLHLMVKSNKITMETVIELLQYLVQEDDLPMSRTDLSAEFQKTFGFVCPL